jgi:hypothetical protein
MGEDLHVGPLTYNVIDTDWKDRLGEGTSARMPSNRFLLIRMSVTNAGNSETIIPTMTLIDSSGTTHTELTDGAGVPDWLGMIRRVQPSQTQRGVVLFDVPGKAYSLQVAFEGEDPESEKTGRVTIPLRFDPESQVPPADKAVPTN